MIAKHIKNTLTMMRFGTLSLLYVFAVATGINDKYNIVDATSYTTILIYYLALSSIFVVIYGVSRMVNEHVFNKRLRHRTEALNNYAQKYNWSVDNSTIPNVTENFGLVQRENARFLYSFGGKDWRYADYVHEKYLLSDHHLVLGEEYYSILELDLDRDLPNIFFDAHKGYGKQYQAKFSKGQISTLDVNFDDSYTVYFPSTYHIDGRSIMSPEVLHAIQMVDFCDIEINNNKLYFYAPMVPAESVDEFIRLAMVVRDKLADHVVFYRDKRVKANASPTSISQYGTLRRRSKFPLLELLVLTAYIAGMTYSLAFATEQQLVEGVFYLVSAYIICYVIIVDWRDRRYQDQKLKNSAERRHDEVRNI